VPPLTLPPQPFAFIDGTNVAQVAPRPKDRIVDLLKKMYNFYVNKCINIITNN
jgi:hypothetical protein